MIIFAERILLKNGRNCRRHRHDILLPSHYLFHPVRSSARSSNSNSFGPASPNQESIVSNASLRRTASPKVIKNIIRTFLAARKSLIYVAAN